MFDWISGKKEADHLHLSEEARQRLKDIARVLQREQSAEGQEISAAAVLEQLLLGKLSLVSEGAGEHLCLTPDEIRYAQQPFGAEPPPAEKPVCAEIVPSREADTKAADLTEAANPTQDLAAVSSHSHQVETLQKQIEMLQTRLNQRRDQQAAQQAKISSLLRKTHQQEQDIASLKGQVEALRQAAAIGESQLNRWRLKNFSR